MPHIGDSRRLYCRRRPFRRALSLSSLQALQELGEMFVMRSHSIKRELEHQRIFGEFLPLDVHFDRVAVSRKL